MGIERAATRDSEDVAEREYREWWSRLSLLAGPPRRSWWRRLISWVRSGPREHDLALREATSLAVSLFNRHYREKGINWKPLPDLRGVISQIDNMTAGMVRAPNPPADGGTQV